MKILNAEQMREADRLTTERCGIPSLTLMENAGAAVVEYIYAAGLCMKPATRLPATDLPTPRVVVLCGKGDNGGDGLVVARRLREDGVAPVVVLLAEPAAMRGDAAANLRRWQEIGDLRVVTSQREWEETRQVVSEADVIVDALLGTGLNAPVTGLLAGVIEDVNSISAKGSGKRHLVAVDMPSGLASGAEDFGGPAIVADATVTFTAPKLGQLVSARADCVGALVVRQIGTPSEVVEGLGDAGWKLRWLEPGEFRGLPLVRKRDANKGSFGHALVIAGSYGKSGAAVLAGRAALRVGAGLVTVATPHDVLPIVAAGMPELMTVPLAATEAGSISMANLDYSRLEPVTRGKSALAMGPGISTEAETQRFVQALVAETALPVILDADGLNAFAGKSDQLASRKTPLLAVTPHPGEMARLVGVTVAEVQASRLDVAIECAARWRAYVILKGFHTILATPDGRAYINSTGNPGMATGGTGDVLTGMLAGLTAEFGTLHWESVLGLGIYLHGLAGDLAAARVGEMPLVASDLIEALPSALGSLITGRDRGDA
jgi:hydroxyethylthiazole kinase-like uncharacterized protein yjeF